MKRPNCAQYYDASAGALSQMEVWGMGRSMDGLHRQTRQDGTGTTVIERLPLRYAAGEGVSFPPGGGYDGAKSIPAISPAIVQKENYARLE